MTFPAKALAASLILAAGMAFAATEDPQVKVRQELMSKVGQNSKVLGEMANGKAAFDAAAAEAAQAALIELAAAAPAAFEPEASDPESEADPKIWTNWDDFVTKTQALGAAATALDPSSVESIGAGMAAVGGACKDCHTDYRL